MITNKGKNLLKLDDEIVRFVLYANIKDLRDIKEIDLNYVGLF